MALSVRVKIAGSVEIFPSHRLHLTPENEVARVLVRKESREKGKLEIAGVTSNAPWLEASARRIESPEEIPGMPAAVAGDWVLEVRAGGDAPTGQSAHQVQFRTGLEREPVVTLPLTVFLPPPVTFSRPTLLLSAPQPGHAWQGVVFTLLRRDVDLSAISIETDRPGLEAEFEPGDLDQRRRRLKVTWLPPDGAPASDGSVTVKAGGQSFRLPVRIANPPPEARKGS